MMINAKQGERVGCVARRQRFGELTSLTDPNGNVTGCRTGHSELQTD
jgi:hypothetical protein